MRTPKVTIDMLVAVIALAQKKTLEHAAEEIGLITPSAAQKRIQATNRLFGEPMFINTEKGMVLTEVGEALYPDALRAVEQVLLAEDKIAALLDLRAGHLRVGHTTYLPPKLLASVLNLNFGDSTGIHIEHHSDLTANVAQRVVEGTWHAGFGVLPVQHPDLFSRVLYEDAVVVCMPSTHRLAGRASIRPQDLEGEPIITVSRKSLPAIHEEIENYFSGFGVSLRTVTNALGPHEAVTMVEQKLGVCMVGAAAVARPGIVGRPLTPQTLTRKSGIFVREDNHHPIVKAYVDVALEKIGRFH
jgi:DNA-binding transcriptional LysR family regulator